jgi:copper chaperone NosL
MKKLTAYSRVAIAVSALLLVSAYFVPLWQILMWAPQYPEGLSMEIWINNLTGDIKIISALNHYIGMKHIEVSMFPEFGYMIYIVAVVIGLGLITALSNRRILLVIYSATIIGCGVAALIDFYLWGYSYGHNLDPTAPIIVPGMSYQPPIIGTKQLLNFTAFSGPAIGGWIFIVSGVMAIGTLVFELFGARLMKFRSGVHVPLFVILLIVSSCSSEPEPLKYGKDACYHCKMTLMDNKFGAEVVSKKGKIYKFDDANCLARFINSETLPADEMAHCLIIDFSRPGKMIDAKTALYVKSDEIKSPMGSHTAAFPDKASAESLDQSWQGEFLSWDSLVGQNK